MKRVLIIRSGAVGDLILTLPVLAALKKRYQGLSIDMIGDPRRLSLLKHCGCVNDVLSIDSREFIPLFASDISPPGHLIQRLGSYDAMLSYLPDPDGVFAKNLRRFASGPVLTGRSRPPDRDRIHMTRVMMDGLKPLGIESTGDPPEIVSPNNASADELRELKSVPIPVALHPGSGGLSKCWPAEHYGALIDLLTESGFSPVVTFGPADHMVRQRLLPWIASRDVRTVENQSLSGMATVYARCRAMIGNDSGMSHLASAVGTPVIALFGPTDPAVWGPRGKAVRILWGTDAFEEDVDRMNWKGPFTSRSLMDIKAMTPFRILSGICATPAQ